MKASQPPVMGPAGPADMIARMLARRAAGIAYVLTQDFTSTSSTPELVVDGLTAESWAIDVEADTEYRFALFGNYETGLLTHGVTFEIVPTTATGVVTGCDLTGAKSVREVTVTGSGATFNYIMFAGEIVAVGVLTGGSGYNFAPDIVPIGGGGSGFAATPTIVGGVITLVTVDDPGSGYSGTPVITAVPRAGFIGIGNLQVEFGFWCTGAGAVEFRWGPRDHTDPTTLLEGSTLVKHTLYRL